MAGQDRFLEIAYGGFTNRGVIIPEHELYDYIQKANKEKQELYHSLFTFDASINDHLREKSSVRGYSGSFGLSRLILDLDRGKLSDELLFKRAKELFEELGQTWGTYPILWYSGTGYHFELPDLFDFRSSPNLPAMVKATVAKHFPWCDHIYHPTGLIRAPWTINLKQHRYKIHVDRELLHSGTHVDIITRASVCPKADEIELATPDETFPHLIVSPAASTKKAEVSSLTLSKFLTCMQKAYNEGEKEGTRHQTILRMSAAWRHQGIPYEVTLDAMIRYAPSLSPPEIERIVFDTYKTGYQYRCDDPVMMQYCDPMCVWFKNKNFGTPVVTAAEAERKFVNFLKSDAFDQTFNLKHIYKLENDYLIFPGEFVVVWGDTKLGKSSWVQNLMRHYKQSVLHLSLENSEPLTYRRYVQIFHNMTREQVFDYYRQNTNTLSDSFDHIKILSISPNLDDVAGLIATTNSKLIVVDTLDSIVTYGDENQRLQRIANTFKDLSERMKVIIIGVHHISKGAALDSDGKERRLTIHSGKYASAIEQKADKIIGIEGDRNQPMRTISSIGARDEHGFEIQVTFNINTLRFTQIL